MALTRIQHALRGFTRPDNKREGPTGSPETGTAPVFITRRRAELGFAAVLVAAAIFCFIEAGTYAGSSGTYPRTLAALLGISALLVFVRTLRQRKADDDKPVFTHPGRATIGIVVLVAYIAAISTIGYLLPSLVLGIALPFALGYRNMRLSILTTLGTLTFIIVVFVMLLGRPVPPDVLQPLLSLIR